MNTCVGTPMYEINNYITYIGYYHKLHSENNNSRAAFRVPPKDHFAYQSVLPCLECTQVYGLTRLVSIYRMQVDCLYFTKNR